MKIEAEKVKAVVLGHAVADALGVPVEFASREALDEAPVTGMKGFGTYPVPAGSWSDDTTMALCALDAFTEKGFDLDRVMENFGRWFYGGEFTPTGTCFDVGGCCASAIRNYCKGWLGTDACGLRGEKDNGNGSLMRIHPFVLLSDREKPLPERLAEIDRASALTHAHPRAMLGCRIYAMLLWALLEDPRREAIPGALRRSAALFGGDREFSVYGRLFRPDFAGLPRREIRSGGYVVDTLEAALWCLLTTGSYRECVLRAVNLGSDTDTVAAVAGGLAGALYGRDAIPAEWRETLLRREWIETLCEKAAASAR